MDLDFSPYAVGGAQARADSFTRLDPNFATGVYGLTQAAHAAGIPLQITSAYRSPPTQARIVADGMAKYGLGDRADAWRADVARLGPVAAGQQWRPEMREAGLTRMIAMPGGSQHQRGTAVDFALNGSLIRDADSPAAQFIRNNAQQYGLSVPMSWEPWQAEPIGNAGRITGAPQATMTTRNAGPALNFRGEPQMAMQPTQPQGLLGQLGIQRRDPTAQGETALPFYQRSRFGNTMGNLAMAFNSLRQRPDENIPRIVTGQRATREQDSANNRTVEWLSSQPGGERFAGLVDSVGAAAALQAYQAEVARTSQPPSAAEAQIARLVASGLPYETAVGIVDDRFVESRDPVTGEANVLDLAQQFLNPQGAEAPTDAATPADTSPDLFGEYTFDSLQNALGIGGAVDSVINRVYEGFGEELPNEEVAAARVGLQNLATRTQLIYAAAFPGRPSNLTREMIASLTVRPEEILSGAQTAAERAQTMQVEIARSIEGAQAVLNSRTSLGEKEAARDVLLRLEPLAQDYASLVNALSRTSASATPAAGLDAALNRYPGASQ